MTTQPKSLTWTNDGTDGPGGDVGGDIQVSESTSRRYVPTDEPQDGLHGLIASYTYVTREEGQSTYGIQNQIEYMVCTDPTDPGMSEVSCTYEYTNLPGTYASIDEAEAAMLAFDQDESGEAFGWDGRTI